MFTVIVFFSIDTDHCVQLEAGKELVIYVFDYLAKHSSCLSFIDYYLLNMLIQTDAL